MAVLLAVSVWNASLALRQYFHWPIYAADDWDRLERDLVHAKSVLSALPDRHIEYQIEGASDTYDPGAFWRLQSILAPMILQHDPVEHRYVLVEFWATRSITALPGLILIEDFGNGFGLYRRQ